MMPRFPFCWLLCALAVQAQTWKFRIGFATKSLFLVCVFAAALAHSKVAAGQSTGAIQGTVTDHNGAVVHGTRVVVTSLRTGRQTSIETDITGAFIIRDLEPAIYRMEVFATGFDEFVIPELKVNGGVVLDQSIQLSLKQSLDPTYTLNVFPGTDPASKYWCGNEGTNALQGINDRMKQGPHCASRATDSSGRPVSAHPNSEVRGWVLGFDGSYASGEVGEEAVFTVELDVGWRPTAPETCSMNTLVGTCPINTLEKLAGILTPSVRHGDDVTKPVIHVEMNGWGPCRTCNYPLEYYVFPFWSLFHAQWNSKGTRTSCSDFQFFSPGRALCNNYLTPPMGWSYVVDGAFLFPILWPLDPKKIPVDPNMDIKDDPNPRPLKTGDYVRMVGTLWEDANHGGDIADTCWAHADTADRGWLEMHPVDYIARIKKPPDHPGGTTVRVLSACAEPDTSAPEMRFIKLDIGPPPNPSCIPKLHEATSSQFTNQRALPRRDIANNRVFVEANLSPGVDFYGHFFGLYQADWDCSGNGTPIAGGCTTNQDCPGSFCVAGFCGKCRTNADCKNFATPYCQNRSCSACNCNNRACGTNACGASCGRCPANYSCNSSDDKGAECVPWLIP